jgi:hypothetical protein
MTVFNLSSSKVVKREVEVVLPVDRFLRLFGLGEGDRSLDVGLGFGEDYIGSQGLWLGSDTFILRSAKDH